MATAAPGREAESVGPSRAREATVSSISVVVLAMVAYGCLLGMRLDNVHNGLLALSFTGVGLYVLRSRPGHTVGLLFVADGMLSAVLFLGRQYAFHDPRPPGAAWAAWLSIWPVPIAMALTGLAVMVFPTGRLLSRGWRIPTIAMGTLAGLLALASSLWPVEDNWRTDGLTFPFDLGAPERVTSVIMPLMVVSYQGFIVVWAVAVIARIRRAVGDETRQLRWFATAVGIFAVVLIGGVLIAGSPTPGLLTTSLIPMAAGAAILKYRLYDIDPVLNKAIVFALLAAVVTAGYVAIVLGMGALVPAPTELLSVLATAVVAVIFEPLRRRAQVFADRLVFGQRSTPYEALAELSTRLREAPDGLLSGIAATTAKAVGARGVMVWAGPADSLALAGSWPWLPNREPTSLLDLETAATPTLRVLPVIHNGVVRGAMTVEKAAGTPMAPAQERLLGDLLAQTGLVIDHQARAGELRAAARRIVTAQDEARRRIERNLHDGAQQRLLALGMELGALAEKASSTGQSVLACRLVGAREQALEATTELRELARGLHPTVLSEEGLTTALRSLADRSPVPVRLHLEVVDRLPAEVEIAAYFMVSEGLTNAARHAVGATVDVTVERSSTGVRVLVADDGPGGAEVGAGSGLQGLADRLAALGGRLEVVSPAGSGTRLEGMLRCD